jgi:hypothetical protein
LQAKLTHLCQLKDHLQVSNQVEALKLLRNKKSPGATDIPIEHLKEWQKGSGTGTTRCHLWSKVVELVQMVFTGADIPKAFCRQWHTSSDS